LKKHSKITSLKATFVLIQHMHTFTALLLLLLASASTVWAIPNFTVTPSGEPTTIWAAVDTLHKCGIVDVP
jgi:hypothetical protein